MSRSEPFNWSPRWCDLMPLDYLLSNRMSIETSPLQLTHSLFLQASWAYSLSLQSTYRVFAMELSPNLVNLYPSLPPFPTLYTMLHLQLWCFYTECKCSREIKEKNLKKRCAARQHKLWQVGRGERGSLDLCGRLQQHKKKLVIILVRYFHSYWQIKLKTKTRLGGKRESEWRQLS